MAEGDGRKAAALEALRATKPPATDQFAYLLVVEDYLYPDVLPEFNEMLQDSELTSLIGWDLVGKLLDMPGGETCLETIARLGNPREVIVKILEILSQMHARAVAGQDGVDGGEVDEAGAESGEEAATPPDPAKYTSDFVVLTGMLSIIHQRIKTKYPSRFLAPSLSAVYQAFLAESRRSDEATGAVIDLVHALSGRRRPALPSRQTSLDVVAHPEGHEKKKANAPDPEAQAEDPAEAALQRRLLQGFVTFVFEAYVNGKGLDWAPRLYESYNSERVVGRKRFPRLQAFREDEALVARDAVVGKLVALAADLGLAKATLSFVKAIYTAPPSLRPITEIDEVPDDVASAIPLSTGGSLCLLAYWVFSKAVFGAPYDEPDMAMFPDHNAILKALVSDDTAPFAIPAMSGVLDAAVALGLWLDHKNLVTAKEPDQPAAVPDFMGYHHMLTLVAVFHPSVSVRGAAASLAGLVLHRDPDESDRLKILEDILENCAFPSLSACAITWLKEELVIASATAPVLSGTPTSKFATPEAVEQLQYLVFPNLAGLLDEPDSDALCDFWAQGPAVHMQAVNFARFLWRGRAYQHLVPDGMLAAVEERYLKPLLHVCHVVREAAAKPDDVEEGKGKGTGDDADALAGLAKMRSLAIDADILAEEIETLSL